MKRHGKHAPDKETLSIVIDSVLKQTLRSRAEAHRRGLSDYVRIILEDAVSVEDQAERLPQELT